MAVTRTVKPVREADLPAENEPGHIQFLSNGTDGYGLGEPIPIPVDRVFTVTKEINFEQLLSELEQALGEPVSVASYQPPTGDDRVGPVPGSKDHPITVYVHCSETGEDVSKTILKTFEAHEADPDWRPPVSTG